MALTKITTGLVAANTLATANIADNSVDATKIASNSILTRHIDDDQITGDQLADNITIAGNLTITGDLTTNGSTVTNSSSNTTIEDAIIELGTGTSGAPATDAGIVIERGSSDNVFIGWDESADKVTVGTGSFTGASTGNLTITAAPFVSGALTASGISYPTSDGSAGQYLKTDGSGALSFGAVTTQVDNYTATGDGSTTAFDTGINPHNEVNTWIFIDGVYQQKSQYSYSGSTVTFSTAPENGALIDVVTGTTGGMASSDTVLGIYEATTTNTATYTTGISASNENNTWVFVGGVYQPKDSYTFSSGTLTFDANTPTGQKLSVVATKALTAGSVETTSLGANAVTAVKIASNSILSRHIANNSIVGADISATTGITAATFTGALTGNVTGNVAGNLTGTILTAAQTNITSVGTLSALTVSGQLTAGGIAYPTSDGSADQVLKTDGSGALSFGTISGTTLNNNTNNYVMTGTGSANTLNGEANLIFDGTSLGIGTANIDNEAKLHIEHSAYPVINLDRSSSLSDGNHLGYINFQNNGDIYGRLAVYAEDVSETDGEIHFQTQKATTLATKMVITSDGNVGIGTTSPTEDLTIASTSPQIRFEDTDASGTPYSKVSGVLGNIYIQADEGNEIADSKIDFRVDGTQRMVIDSSGNVGIGVADPTTYNASDKLALYSTGNTSMVIAAGTSGESSVFMADGTSSTASYMGYLQYHHSDNHLRIGVNATERMRIDSSGNVGIGATSIDEKLHIEVASGDAAIKLEDASGDYVRIDQNSVGANDKIRFKTGSSLDERMRIASNGDVQLMGGNQMTNALAWYNTTSYELASIENVSHSSYNDSGGLAFKTAGLSNSGMAERMRIDSSGYLLLRATSTLYDGGQLQLTSAGDLSSMYVTNTGFASHGNMVAVERGGTSAYSFAQYYSGRRPDNGGGDREFNFRGDGQAYADASWNASGADYAEYFEWADGNTDNNDRVGHTVSLVNNKIKIAESGETVIGVISGNPSVVGDASWNKWQGKHMRDDYGRYIWEEYTEEDGTTVDDKGNKLTRRKLNPDYNSETAYINREDRKEWDVVGLMGKLRIKKGQQTGTNWIKMRDISDAVEEWLVR